MLILGLSIADAVQLVSVIVAAVATVVALQAARSSHKAVIIMRESLAPNLVAYLDCVGREFYLVVENVGSSVAEDIGLNISPVIPTKHHSDAIDILFRLGISSLCPGQEKRTFLDSSVACLSNPDFAEVKFIVTVEYLWGEVKRRSKSSFIAEEYRWKLVAPDSGSAT